LGAANTGKRGFLRKLKERYTVNASQLEGIGSSISFLKRKMVRIPNGLALVPWTS